MKVISSILYAIFKIVLFQVLLGLFFSLKAQFNTPSINGNIGVNEYGNHSNTQNFDQDWYLTWDNTNLYIAIQNSDLNETAILYLKTNPTQPINGGTNADGTNIGSIFDNTNFAELPFRANLFIAFRNTYREYRTSTGSNTWSSSTTFFGSYADGAGNVREVSIPWSVIGGRPASFAWFGYITRNTGFVYKTVPSINATGNIGTSARYERYYIVNNTENSTSIKPFSRDCYVFNRTSDATGFADIQVWDFTMNTTGRTIFRKTDAGNKNWDIGGDLVVNNGTIDFNNVDYSGGGVTATTNIGNDFTIANGSLIVRGNRDIFQVNGDFLMTSGNFTLSTLPASNGFLLRGNWTRNGGTFTHNNRNITFNGTNLQTLQNNLITEDFYNLIVNKSNNIDLRLLTNISVSNLLTITLGDLDLNNNNIDLLTAGALSEDIFNGHLVKDKTAIDDATQGGKIIANNRAVNNTITNVSGLGIILSDATGYNVNIERMHYRGGFVGIRRVYKLVGTPTNTNIQINYSEEEIPSPISESDGFKMFRWTNLTGWQTLSDVTQNTSTNNVTKTGQINAFSHWTLGSQLIPLATNDLILSGNNAKNLTWNVLPEKQTIGYELQKSKNLVDFETIFFKDATYNNNQNQTYFYSYTQNEDILYYRIKQIYQNQETKLSNILTLKNETNFQIYPNPSHDNIDVKIPYAWENDKVILILTDMQGKNMNNVQINANEIENYLQNLLLTLAKGTYIIQLKNIDKSNRFLILKWIII
ncbi:MAG: T9SS C-terminal target domain-containing protein [Bacteroidetes bacterium]|nr:MAG: T9SS C-terminal target domain-containing protein [Bacteroidota bacterium]